MHWPLKPRFLDDEITFHRALHKALDAEATSPLHLLHRLSTFTPLIYSFNLPSKP
jgi:hypothetical protein